jgi:DNA polymerase III sliding clamp (beta) subunit (PCNA family)
MNKFIISTTTLAPALRKLSLAIHKSGPLPALGNLLVKASEGSVVFIASDVEITIHYRMDCECKEAFEFLVPFEFLNKIVAINKHCPLTFELGKSLKIIDEKGPYEVKSPEKVETFPKLQELPKKQSFTIDSAILQSVTAALATTGNPTKHPETEFVLMELEEGKITIASSDKHSMVYSKVFPKEVAEPQQLLLSPKIIKVLEGCDSATVYHTKKIIGFVAGDITIVNTRSEMRYADFRKVFPADWPANMTVSRAELLAALGKCAISSDESRTTNVDLSSTTEMKLLADDGIVKINPSLDYNYTGEVKQTIVNSDKLMKLLQQVNYPDICFAIHDMNRQIILSSPSDEGYLAMIMPIAQSVKK